MKSTTKEELDPEAVERGKQVWREKRQMFDSNPYEVGSFLWRCFNVGFWQAQEEEYHER